MSLSYLVAGNIIIGREETKIVTILGSCVGVAIVDMKAGIGGLNHYLLPNPFNDEPDNARYGSFAIPELIRLIQSQGGSLKDMKAKVYGGARLHYKLSETLDVGQYNLKVAHEYLHKLKIPVLEQNIGGIKGRRICLDISNFEVHHQFLGSAQSQFKIGA